MSETAEVSVVLNGEARKLPAGLSISGLLEFLELRTELVAVELNRRVIPRGEHTEVGLSEGDEIEVVSFVGGG